MGFARNLNTAEIVAQVLLACPKRKGEAGLDRLNVVFMGMGEPLANRAALFRAIEILNDPDGASVGARRMTVSTAGIPSGMRSLARFDVQVGLAVSLNAADDELRSRLMPINDRYPLRQVIDAAAYFAAEKGRRVTLEYVLLGGVNDRLKDAKALAAVAREIPSKINLIAYNGCPDLPFRAPGPEAVRRFVEYLYEHAPAVTLRRSRGADIGAACGQLCTAVRGRRAKVRVPKVQAPGRGARN